MFTEQEMELKQAELLKRDNFFFNLENENYTSDISFLKALRDYHFDAYTFRANICKNRFSVDTKRHKLISDELSKLILKLAE